jgi:hypothetical protein
MRPWLIGSAARPGPLIIEYDSLSLYRQAQGRRRIHLDRSTLADRWGQRACTRQHPDDRSGTLLDPLDLPAPGASCRGDTLRRPRDVCARSARPSSGLALDGGARLSQGSANVTSSRWHSAGAQTDSFRASCPSRRPWTRRDSNGRDAFFAKFRRSCTLLFARPVS